MDGWRDEQMMDEWITRWLDGRLDGWLDGRWMDG